MMRKSKSNRAKASGLAVGWLLLASVFEVACSGADDSSSEPNSGGGIAAAGATIGGSLGGVPTFGGSSKGGTNGNASGSSYGGNVIATQGGSSASATSGGSGGTILENGGATSGGARPSGGSSATSGGPTAGGGSSGVAANGGERSSGGNTGRGGSTASGGRALGGNSNTGGNLGGRSFGGNSAGGVPASGGGSQVGGAFALDCGPIGWAVEAHGPPENRVNYAIVGDGYLAGDLVAGGSFERHVNTAMTKRFSVPIGEVYSRYRKFVNICAIKLASNGAICSGSSALGCCGDDSTRLARCNSTAANSAFRDHLPANFLLDWRAVVLNGNSWWNTGSALMLWSGGHADAAGAALHEGGHGFHQLADEYTGSGSSCSNEYAEVNSTANSSTTSGKWDRWLNYTQVGATGLQSTFEGSRYCTAGQFRPSSNSMMNSLFGNNPNTSYNSVSREQMIFTIWRAVVPIDAVIPPAGAVSNPATLRVVVIDPAVIDVDWSVDGTVVVPKGGETFDVAARALPSGSHVIAAKAYDNAGEDLVRYRNGTCPASVTGGYCSRAAWNRSQQTVTWTVTVP